MFYFNFCHFDNFLSMLTYFVIFYKVPFCRSSFSTISIACSSHRQTQSYLTDSFGTELSKMACLLGCIDTHHNVLLFQTQYIKYQKMYACFSIIVLSFYVYSYLRPGKVGLFYHITLVNRMVLNTLFSRSPQRSLRAKRIRNE